MKKNSFTLCELVLVVAVVALFAAVFSGCGLLKEQMARAQSKDCVNNLKQLGTAGMMYLNDHRIFWANSESKSYAWNLARGKYLQNEMPPKKGAWTCCPSIERDPGQQGRITEFDQSNIQMYAAVGTIGKETGYLSFGINFSYSGFSRGADRISGEILNESVAPSQRIWFADGLRPDTQRQRTLLITESFYQGRPDCARPYAVHGGRINLVTDSGVVMSLRIEELKDYYLPYLPSDDPREMYSVRVNTYISSKDPKRVLNIVD